MPDFDSTLAEAQQLIADELHRYALDAIAALLEDETARLTTAQRQVLLQLAHQIWVALDDGTTKVYGALTEALAKAAAAPDDPRAIFDAAYQLIERQAPHLAGGLLVRAWSANPSELKLLHELVAALELQGRYADARDRLRVPAEQADAAFLTRYLYAFNSIVVDDYDTARAILRTLAPGGDTSREFMVARLEDALRRADLVGSAASSRARQFVFSGSLLLDAAPDIVTAREEQWATYAEHLVRLREVLRAIDRAPSRAVSLRTSRKEMMARAAAAIFEIPFAESWYPDGEGLYPTEHLAAMQPDVAAAFAQHQPGQIYYAHFAPTERELPFAADAIGTRGTDGVIAPWDLWCRLDYTRPDRPAGAPTETQAEMAALIAAAAPPPESLADLPPLLDLARRAHAAGLLELGQDRGQRERLWAWPRS